MTATSSSGVVVSGSGSGSLVLTGSVAALNAWLADTSHVHFTGPANLTGDNAATLDVSVADRSGAVALGTINVDIFAPGNAQMLDGLAATVTFAENTVNSAAQLMQMHVAYSTLSGTFDGGHLSVSGLLAEDIVSVQNGGSGAGQVGLSGARVTYEGVEIGTLSGALADMNGDMFLFVGNSSTSLKVCENTRAGFTEMSAADNPFSDADIGRYATPALADFNGDGALDVVIGNSAGKFTLYEGMAPHIEGMAFDVNVVDRVIF